MYTWHQKNQLGFDHPFVMFYSHESIAFQKHWHEEIEVIYIKQGSALAEINGIRYDIAEGDIIFVGSRESHQYTSENREGISLIFDISTAAFGDHREKVANSEFCTPVLKKPSSDAESHNDAYCSFVRLFESIIQAYERKSATYDLFLRARILDISWMILEELDLTPVSFSQKVKQYNSNEKLNDVFRFVQENYHQDLDLRSVASMCNFSPTYFAKLFKDSVGVPFCKYLSDFRIQQARILLTETENSVTQISYTVGFRSMQTFERVFKSALGISPSDYRKFGAVGQTAIGP